MRFLVVLLALAAVLIAPACSEDASQASDPSMTDGSGDGGEDSGNDDGSGEAADGGTADIPLRPRSNPSEYVGMAFRQPIDLEGFRTLSGGIFGEAASEGSLHDNLSLHPGVLLTVTEDDRTPDQVVMQIDMEVSSNATPPRRTIFRAPASFAYGEVFIAAVEAALLRLDEVSSDPDDQRAFEVEYRVRSANGGSLDLAVIYDLEGVWLDVEIRGPRTSLADGAINQPMFTGDPYETIYGLVYFELSRDNFDFFVNRAYGLSAGANQNFTDFQLLPHNWLRLTVTPELDDRMVDVSFEVIAPGGDRVPVARAPASVTAGEQFMQNVFLMVDMMNAQEAEEPGSSLPWTVPFYYDDPDGGGVVEVIANGQGGRFQIAYAVESPTNFLRDVDFVEYQGDVVIPDDWDAVDPTCSELGGEPAPQGMFDVTFDASSTVRNAGALEGELRGNIYGSVFRAEDVTIAGPVDGAEAVASFRFDDVDIRDGASTETYRIDTQLLAGEYQILGFMDTDQNADPDNPDPDPNDPVMIPIGAFELACAIHPVTVEFALLLPE